MEDTRPAILRDAKSSGARTGEVEDEKGLLRVPAKIGSVHAREEDAFEKLVRAPRVPRAKPENAVS